MASNGIQVLTFIFFCTICIIPLRGRNIAEDENVEKNIPAQALHPTGPSDGILDDGHFKHVAGYSLIYGMYHGLKAKMSVWELSDVKPNSVSTAYIAASSYEADRFEMIQAGFHVYPGLYKNYDIRFFTYWTTDDDGVSTGCFNTNCPGFVIADDANLYPGQALAKPYSTYDNETYYIILRIKKDEQTGDWSIYREDMGGPIGGTTLLGWWPKSLFKGLADYATTLEWKGEVQYLSSESGPSMGSGHFAEEEGRRAAYFGDILGFDVVDFKFIPQAKDVTDVTNKKECYDVSDWRNGNFLFHSGSQFYYGGPAGCSG